MILNCIAIDDEPLAAGLISSFIEKTPFLHLMGTFTNAVEALETIHRQDLHLIFCDIQMPEFSGMELAKTIYDNNGPKIIFTTAYNHFAIEGYKVDALDYLLKPFGYDEFLRAATKAKNYFEEKQQDPVVEEPYLFVKADYRLVRIDLKDILYIESVKDYIKIHLISSPKPVMSLSTLKSIEEKLPASSFIRLHRSYIVAIHKIDSITKNAVHLGNVDITVGDQYKEAFKELLSKWV